MYSIGSKVVHPRHGAGTIVRVQEKRFGDVTNTYYVIDTISREMQVMVPVERAEGMGLRHVKAASELRQVLASCRVAPSDDEIEKDYRARQNVLGEQLKSGRYDEVASAVRVLFHMNSQRALGTTDRALFERGKDILAGELALASDLEILEAMQEVEDNLAEMLFPEDE
jgi:CarD family transcriptional regulator